MASKNTRKRRNELWTSAHTRVSQRTPWTVVRTVLSYPTHTLPRMREGRHGPACRTSRRQSHVKAPPT